MNKKYEANHFLKMFSDREQSFNGLEHLTEKVTAVASLTRVWLWSTTQCQPHQTTKVKDLALIF